MELRRHPISTEFYFDFHGHTLSDGKEMTVATLQEGYRHEPEWRADPRPSTACTAGTSRTSRSTMWWCTCASAGSNELVRPGETGNEAHIIANVPADRAIAKK